MIRFVFLLSALFFSDALNSVSAEPPQTKLEQQIGASEAPDRLQLQVAIEPTSIALSEKAILTLTIEGPIPLLVSFPTLLLTEESLEIWKVNRLNESQELLIQSQREKRQYRFELIPYVPGENVPIQLSAISIQAGNAVTDRKIEWDGALSIAVRTSIKEVDLSGLRPHPGIEEVPPLEESSQSGWWYLIVCLIFCFGIWILFWRRQKVKQHLDFEKNSLQTIAKQLESLQSSEVNLLEWADRFSHLLRELLEIRYSFLATHLTTRELVNQLRDQALLPSERLTVLESYLQECDRIRFSGSTNSTLSRMEWTTTVMAWLAES